MANRYNLRGVSSDKEDVHNAIKNQDKGLFPKAFVRYSLTIFQTQTIML